MACYAAGYSDPMLLFKLAKNEAMSGTRNKVRLGEEGIFKGLFVVFYFLNILPPSKTPGAPLPPPHTAGHGTTYPSPFFFPTNMGNLFTFSMDAVNLPRFFI